MSGDTDQISPEQGTSDLEEPESVVSEASSESSSFIRQGFFPFLELPPEIRNVVYRIIVVNLETLSRTLKVYCHESCIENPHGCYCSYKDRILPHPMFQAKKDLKIFLVNRQLWTESSEIFYAENIFNFNLNRPGPKKVGFHPCLKRIRKCYLWAQEPEYDDRIVDLCWASADVDGYTNDLMVAFTQALGEEKVLDYLVVNITCRDDSFLQPFEVLQGIKLVHVQRHCVHEEYGSSQGPCNIAESYGRRLSVLMMSNGEYSSIDDIPEQHTRASEGTLMNSDENVTKDKKFERMKHVCLFSRWLVNPSSPRTDTSSDTIDDFDEDSD